MRGEGRFQTMIVMPSNSSGWFFHTLAHETGRLGHLFSPGGQRGPWPWFPYALDNGCFALWNPDDNSFDEGKWATSGITAWQRLLFWAEASPERPRWLIVPDRPGSGVETLAKWNQHAAALVERKVCKLAIAVQDGMTSEDVRQLAIQPDVIAVGGSTEWKWSTIEMWAKEFPRVHLLRCNSPEKLYYLEKLGVESTDGTGWNRGNRVQTEGLERWERSKVNFGRVEHYLYPHVCRTKKEGLQTSFA